MCSEPRRRAALLRLGWLFLGWLCLPTALASPSLTLPPLEQPREAWLITMAPGDLYWQRFGHNAIWLREPDRGLDHSFNFGYFDFAQEHFFWRFLQGRMRYQSLAFEAVDDFSIYAAEGRAIRAQRLDLDPEQYARLREHLLWHVRPEHRDYLYDYYRDNCSTRIRDALDLAVSGGLNRRFSLDRAEQGYRDHTRSLTAMTFWYYLGLELLLGGPVDRPISRWEEMFIPAVLADTVAMATNDGRPLVAGEAWLTGASGRASTAPVAVWPRYLLAGGLLLAALLWLGSRTPAAARRLARSWLFFSGSVGMVLLGLWAFTDHWAAAYNANALLFNPLLVLAARPRLDRFSAALAGLGVALAAAQAFGPSWQYARDVVAFAGPATAAAAVVLWRPDKRLRHG